MQHTDEVLSAVVFHFLREAPLNLVKKSAVLKKKSSLLIHVQSRFSLC